MPVTGLDNIVDSIRLESEEKIKKLWKDFELRKSALVEETYRSIKSFEEKKVYEVLERMKEQDEKAESLSLMKYKNGILKAKLDISREVLESAKAYILNLPEDEYFSIVLNICSVHFSKSKSAKLILSKNDFGRISDDSKQKFLDKARDCGMNLEIIESESDKNFGGAILDFSNVEENCTLEALFDEHREDLLSFLLGFLFTKRELVSVSEEDGVSDNAASSNVLNFDSGTAGSIKENETGTKKSVVGSKTFDGSVSVFEHVDDGERADFDARGVPDVMTSKSRKTDDSCDVPDDWLGARKFNSRVRRRPLTSGKKTDVEVGTELQNEVIPGFEHSVSSKNKVSRNGGVLSSGTLKAKNSGKNVVNADDDSSDGRKFKDRALKKMTLKSGEKKQKNIISEVDLQNEVIPGFERADSENAVLKGGSPFSDTSNASDTYVTGDVSKKSSTRRLVTTQSSGLKRSRASKTLAVSKRKASSADFPKEDDDFDSRMSTSSKEQEKKDSSAKSVESSK